MTYPMIDYHNWSVPCLTMADEELWINFILISNMGYDNSKSNYPR